MAIFNVKFEADPRDWQIGFLLAFLGLGVWARDWANPALPLLELLLVCLGSQGILTALSQGLDADNNKVNFSQGFSWGSFVALAPALKSAAITALGLSLLLRANHGPTFLLAGAAAIVSKFLIQINGKHVFNPANFGIITALLLSRDAWISPGQWGNAPWLAALFLGAGGLILGKVGRWETTVVFLGSYGALELAGTLWLGWPPTLAGRHLGSGSLLVFAFFMISDPRSTPDHPWGRALWALSLAGLTFALRYGAHCSSAPFWALFLCSPLTAALDSGLTAPRFIWGKSLT